MAPQRDKSAFQQRSRGETSPLADLIRRRMEANGWTLQLIAERSGLSLATVWALRDGSRGKRPRSATLLKLAKGLQIAPEQLFEMTEARGEDPASAREGELLAQFRRLDDYGRRAVESLLEALVPPDPAARADRVQRRTDAEGPLSVAAS